MKKVAIVGTQGVPAKYGGFETLVENIIGENSAPDIEYTVFCSAKDYETKRAGYKRARLKYISMFHANGMQSIPYDILSMLHCVRGFDTVVVPESASRSARMRRAVFQPLSLVEIDASILPRRDIHRIRHASIVVATPSLHTNPTKCAIALFITELLSHIIIEQEQDAPLYAFLARSVMLLDNIDSRRASSATRASLQLSLL